MSTGEEKEKKQKGKADAGIVTKESISAVCALFTLLALLILFTRDLIFGEIGVAVHTVLLGAFGYAAYPLFLLFGYISVTAFFGVRLIKNRKGAVLIGVALALLSLVAHTALTFAWANETYLAECFNAGAELATATVTGWFGGLIVLLLRSLTTPVGALVILSALALAAVYLAALVLAKKGGATVQPAPAERTEERATPETQQPQAVAEPVETPRPQADETPMPGYYAGYPYGTADVRQRPGVTLGAQQPTQPTQPAQSQAGRVFSPFGATSVGQAPAAPERPMTPEESRAFLFGGDPAENYRRNLIFDGNASVNRRPSVTIGQPTPPTYSDVYASSLGTPTAKPQPQKIVDDQTPTARTYETPVPPVAPTPETVSRVDATFEERSTRRGDMYSLETPEESETPVTRGGDAYRLETPEEERTTEPFAGRAVGARAEETAATEETGDGYARHDYMGLFSLSNPNVFGASDDETEDTETLEEVETAPRDRSALFDDDASEEELPVRGETPFDSGRSTRFETASRRYENDDEDVETAQTVSRAKNTVVEPPASPKPRIIKPYVRIPLDYFDCSDIEPTTNEEEEEHIKRMILGTLADYKVTEATIASVTHGPTVTRYNVAIPRSVSPKKVVALEQEIAISLCSKGVNIYPSFEDGAVSVEVPNKTRQFVQLGCMLSDEKFINAKATSLTFAMGKDVSNRKVYGDICKMTHLLVAGASGAGKSAFLGSLIISLIVKYSPEELRLILIDPKKTEFVLYNNLPHLMINEIITDSGKAIQSLNWAIGEMNRRYELFKMKSLSGTYVVNVDEYNAHLTGTEEKLPKIVIIVDELADLMLAAKKDMEDRIQNLTQKARAAGIHLILATQRPSADVITGVIKGNLSTRIAFTVASDVDSRVILDQTGAQKLLGMGDLLYTSSGINTPVRVQGAFISSADSQKVVDFIKANNEAYYDESATAFINKSRMGGDDGMDGGDGQIEEVYITALKLVIQMGGASISMLQRKCSIGFNKAGKIIEWMEAMEYISPFEGSAKARKVLITKEEFERLYGEF